jgi:hypothetical protein
MHPLCRVPDLGYSAKAALCRVLDLGHSASARIRHSAKKSFFKKYSHSLPSALNTTLGKGPICRALFLALTLYATVCAICAHYSKYLLYFVNLFHFIEFLVIFEIWTTSHTNNGKQWMKKWYSRYWKMRWDLIEKKLEISNLLSTKHDDELLVQLFLKCIKSKYGPKIMKLVEM